MRYELKKIVNFADEILAGRIGMLRIEDSWEAHQYFVWFAFKKISAPKGAGFIDYDLFLYAYALSRAAKYLIEQRNNGTPVSPPTQIFMENQLDELVKHYHILYPKGKIKAPLPIVYPTDTQVAHTSGSMSEHLRRQKQFFEKRLEKGIECEPELNGFVNSKSFQDLEKYLQKVLQEDNRSHSYFCGLFNLSERRKAPVLNQFIYDLKSRSDMDEVRRFLQEFYAKDHTRFNILNKGQNITTRACSSLFGKQSTTLNLIDALAKSIGVNPKEVVSFSRQSLDYV